MVQQTHRAPWIASLDRSVLSSESDDSSSDSDSDSSWKSLSPITSDDEDDFSGDSGDKETVSSSDDENFPDPSNTSPQQTESSAAQNASSDLNKQGSFKSLFVLCIPNTFLFCEVTYSVTLHVHVYYTILYIPLGSTCMFHLIGDNVDEGVKQQYMRFDVSKPDSIHYFHSFAVADQADFSSLSEQIIPTEQTNAKQVALSLLPSSEDDSAMRDNICVLISRVLFRVCHSSISLSMV